MPTLIITGGSSGIGAATAQLFARRGYTVFELSRHGKDAQNIKHITCDVTKPEDCQRAVSAVVDNAGKIDVLVSNAGFGISGAVEFTEANEARRQFDVNFFGTVNIVKAVTPYMRRQQHGRIILVGSMAAVFPGSHSPKLSGIFQAFYSASKAAVSAFAHALRNELRPFGIIVSCLLPGDVKTSFTDRRDKNLAASDIYPAMQRAVAVMEHDEQPQCIARKLLQLARRRRPPLYTTAGLQYHLFAFLNKLLPASLVCRLVGKIYS